jgi:hypothetical protein
MKQSRRVTSSCTGKKHDMGNREEKARHKTVFDLDQGSECKRAGGGI